MKVVINKEIGGFGLSKKAFERLIELGMTLTSLNSEGQFIDPKADIYKSNYHDFNEKLEDKFHYNFTWYREEIDIRSNPLVIKVVEELGPDAADECTLKIVEIPDGVNVFISEDDDGTEYIAEKCRTWS
jgi:hypothetical protein